MDLLLDTHIWIWSLTDLEKLSRRVRKALENDEENNLWLSPISIWEFVLLCEKKRFNLDEDPATWVHDALTLAPMKEAPVTSDVALALSGISLSHGDPVDRFLIATAQVYGLTLVTADHRLLSSKIVPILSNLS